MQNKMNAGKNGHKTKRMQDNTDTGQKGKGTKRVQDRSDASQEDGCGKQCMEVRKRRLQAKIVAIQFDAAGWMP